MGLETTLSTRPLALVLAQLVLLDKETGISTRDHPHHPVRKVSRRDQQSNLGKHLETLHLSQPKSPRTRSANLGSEGSLGNKKGNVLIKCTEAVALTTERVPVLGVLGCAYNDFLKLEIIPRMGLFVGTGYRIWMSVLTDGVWLSQFLQDQENPTNAVQPEQTSWWTARHDIYGRPSNYVYVPRKPSEWI